MNRRDFLFETFGAATLAFPALARAQARPCPPPLVSSEEKTIASSCTESGSTLARAAAALSVGHSIKLDTSLLGSTLEYGSEGYQFTQWGSSAYYDPTRREIGFIGKRYSTFPYHWLVYDEANNTWSNSRPVASLGNTGHGYDHSTIDPATGTVYHRAYGTKTVYAWNGSWSALPAWTPDTGIVGGLTWFPGVGLMFNEGPYLLRYPIGGPSWQTVSSSIAGDSYHDFSEYNSAANVMIFGGGNLNVYFKMTSSLTVSSIATPPFSIGASETQGYCVSDPASANFIAHARVAASWSRYSVAGNNWSSLTQSSGSGASQQMGTPALSTDPNYSIISCSIPDYGVMMFIQYKGSGSTPADVWLYRHDVP